MSQITITPTGQAEIIEQPQPREWAVRVYLSDEHGMVVDFQAWATSEEKAIEAVQEWARVQTEVLGDFDGKTIVAKAAG